MGISNALISVLTAIALTVVPAHAEPSVIGAGPLRVGIAQADITPVDSVRMAGFGARKEPSRGVERKLTATCVVFDNGVMRLAFLALDLCKIMEKQLDTLRVSAEKAGIPPQHLMINCSHTHYGPEMRGKRNGCSS